MSGELHKGYTQREKEILERMRYILIGILSVVYLVAGCPEYLAGDDMSLWLKACTHHIFHANIFHLAVNCLSIWVVFSPKRKDNCRTLILAFIIASLSYFIALRPVVGVSNILFASLGLRTPHFKHPWWKAKSTLIFLAVTLLMFFFPQFSAITHVSSFLCGVLVSLIIRRIKSLDHDYKRAVGK